MKYYETVEDHKVQCNLITKLFALKNSLNEMFPHNKYRNIGEKVEEIDRNVYVNDFYYQIFETGKN